MNSAEKIMKKKADIKAELDKALPKAQSDRLWREATARLYGAGVSRAHEDFL